MAAVNIFKRNREDGSISIPECLTSGCSNSASYYWHGGHCEPCYLQIKEEEKRQAEEQEFERKVAIQLEALRRHAGLEPMTLHRHLEQKPR